MITFAGHTSDEFNVFVQHYPVRTVPKRRTRTTQIPGRNGDLVEDLGAYDNVVQSYEIYVSAELETLPWIAAKVANWLTNNVGYQVLEDSYDTAIFRRAVYQGPMDIENILNMYGRAKINFLCDPRRFQTFGADPITITTSGTAIKNPTAFNALPLVKVSGSGAGVVSLGGVTITLSDIPNGLTIDSELKDCYSTGLNANQYVTLSPAHTYPVLEPGTSTVTFSGGVTGVEITPRWWQA